MKTILSFSALFLLLSFSDKPLTFKDVNENILCEARKCFNPEKDRQSNQYGHPPLLAYIGSDLACINGKMERIESLTQSRSYTNNMLTRFNTKNQLTYIKSGESMTTFKYDQAGHIIEIKDDGSVQKITYSGSFYTKFSGNGFYYILKRNGLTTTDQRYDSQGNIELNIIKQFDEKKRLISEKNIWLNRTDKNSAYQYFYDKNGQVIKKISNIGFMADTTFLIYNDDGFITKDSSVDSKGRTSIAFYTYNISNEQNLTTIRQNRLYADSSGGPLIYSFDQKGNWTRCMDYTGEILLTDEERKIYYR